MTPNAVKMHIRKFKSKFKKLLKFKKMPTYLPYLGGSPLPEPHLFFYLASHLPTFVISYSLTFRARALDFRGLAPRNSVLNGSMHPLQPTAPEPQDEQEDSVIYQARIFRKLVLDQARWP
jgi:hypothetical protein